MSVVFRRRLQPFLFNGPQRVWRTAHRHVNAHSVTSASDGNAAWLPVFVLKDEDFDALEHAFESL